MTDPTSQAEPFEPKDIPEPCTFEARYAGCTCRMESVNSASIDSPEPIIDGWCPLHGGRDPDRELDEMRDSEMEEPETLWECKP